MAYSYKHERETVARKLREFHKLLTESRRAAKDPVQVAIVLKCQGNCRQKVRISERTWSRVGFAEAAFGLETAAEIIKAHNHFAKELGFSQVAGLFVLSAGHNFLVICPVCTQVSPFPYSNPHQWLHGCSDGAWSFAASSPPVMRWNAAGSLWILDVPFHNKIQETLLGLPDNHVKRDKNKHVWLISDAISEKVAIVVHRYYPEFKWMRQEKLAAEERARKMGMRLGGTPVDAKSIAAGKILDALPREMLMLFFKKAARELHPDLQPVELRETYTQRFQDFQVNWKEYIASRGGE